MEGGETRTGREGGREGGGERETGEGRGGEVRRGESGRGEPPPLPSPLPRLRFPLCLSSSLPPSLPPPPPSLLCPAFLVLYFLSLLSEQAPLCLFLSLCFHPLATVCLCAPPLLCSPLLPRTAAVMPSSAEAAHPARAAGGGVGGGPAVDALPAGVLPGGHPLSGASVLDYVQATDSRPALLPRLLALEDWRRQRRALGMHLAEEAERLTARAAQLRMERERREGAEEEPGRLLRQLSGRVAQLRGEEATLSAPHTLPLLLAHQRRQQRTWTDASAALLSTFLTACPASAATTSAATSSAAPPHQPPPPLRSAAAGLTSARTALRANHSDDGRLPLHFSPPRPSLIG